MVDFATAADLETMADLLAELFTLESDFLPDRVKQLAGLKLILDNPGAVVRGPGGGHGQRPHHRQHRPGHRVLLLEDVILHRDHRGAGLGRRLVEQVLDWAAGEA